MFDLAIIVKMRPPDDPKAWDRWRPRHLDFAAPIAELADRLTEELRARTGLEVRRGEVGTVYVDSLPLWPDGGLYPTPAPSPDLGQAIYLRDALVGLAAVATITKIIYDFVKEFRKGPPDLQGEDAPRIVLQIYLRSGEAIDTTTTSAAEANRRLETAATDQNSGAEEGQVDS